MLAHTSMQATCRQNPLVRSKQGRTFISPSAMAERRLRERSRSLPAAARGGQALSLNSAMSLPTLGIWSPRGAFFCVLSVRVFDQFYRYRPPQANGRQFTDWTAIYNLLTAITSTSYAHVRWPKLRKITQNAGHCSTELAVRAYTRTAVRRSPWPRRAGANSLHGLRDRRNVMVQRCCPMMGEALVYMY